MDLLCLLRCPHAQVFPNHVAYPSNSVFASFFRHSQTDCRRWLARFSIDELLPFHRRLTVELRKALDPLPALARVHSLYTDVIEIRVEYCGALLRKRRRTVILFFPDRNAT